MGPKCESTSEQAFYGSNHVPNWRTPKICPHLGRVERELLKRWRLPRRLAVERVEQSSEELGYSKEQPMPVKQDPWMTIADVCEDLGVRNPNLSVSDVES